MFLSGRHYFNEYKLMLCFLLFCEIQQLIIFIFYFYMLRPLKMVKKNGILTFLINVFMSTRVLITANTCMYSVA